MAHCAPDCALVNASYPDAVNPVLKALNLNVLCGVGNVGILAAVWEEHATAGGPVSILAHHSDLSQIAHSDVPTNGRVRAWVRDTEVSRIDAALPPFDKFVVRN